MHPYLLSGLLILALALVGDGFRRPETFDQAGTSWTDTRFSDVLALPGSEFVREVLGPASGAPNTTPALPINAFGDKEGVYREVTLAATHSYSLMADEESNVLCDGGIRGYVAIGNPDPFGSQTVGFVLRATVDPASTFRLDGYAANISHNGGGLLSFGISRVRAGVITASDVLARGFFSGDLAQENYLIELHARGDLFVGRVQRVSVAGGNVVHSPILLSTPSGALTEVLVGHDATFPSGRAGVWGFTRGGNSVFFDDVEVGVPLER